jgi:HAMP domain-containing protein
MQGYLLNEKGTELFSIHENQSASQTKNKRIVILVARELLSRLNKSMKVDSGTLMMEATEDFFTSVLDQNFDFNVLIKSMGELIPMAFGNEGSYLYSEAIQNSEGRAEYAVIFAANRSRVARQYISDNIRSLSSQQDFTWQVNAYGLNNLAGKVITTPHQLPKIQLLSKTLLARNAPVLEIQASGSTKILWYCQRGAHLADFALVANTSLEPLQQQIHLKWFYLLLLAATLFIVATLLGFTLSTQFLTPIENLTEGVKAIEKRQFDLKIPVLSRDELGQLSTLLNSVLEGMKDLQVASIVQTSLFPAEPLFEKGIEIFGSSRAMTDIGGDYFDYFVADENRIIGLVGDVSGHGVSAALIMGMAKYAFTTAEAARRPLTETLGAFNLFLLSHIKRKKMMTMFLYSINTETYEIEYANAGHNPPYHLINTTKGTVSIEMDSFPLGIRAKSKYRAAKFSFAPGDKLLMYTDGLIETNTIGQEPIGYELSREWFAQTGNLAARESVEAMFARFDLETGNLPPEDDISMIVIRRLPEKN